MGKKPKQKKSGSYIVDNVDTTSLTLKQLQTFCEKVYEELLRTGQESRSLELERNKLKTMVELSTQELIRAKRDRRGKEWELGQSLEAFISEAMEQQKELRNVKNEKSQEIMFCKAVASDNLQILQRDSDECRAHIEQDIRQLRAKIAWQDVDQNRKITALKQQLEREKSTLLSTSDNDAKLQTSGYEKQMLDMTSKLKKKGLQECEELKEYKIRMINEFLNTNEKLMTGLRHYYNKLLQRNMNVLNDFHEKYLLVKDDIKQISSKLKIHKEIAAKIYSELGDNKRRIEELKYHLANSSTDQKILKETKLELVSKQKKLKHHHWDNLFLEEASRIKKKDQMAAFAKEEKILFGLKTNVTSKMLQFECWASKIMLFLTQIKKIIESGSKECMDDMISPHFNMISPHFNMSVIRDIAFAQLEQEAKKEEKEKNKNEVPKVSLKSD